MIDSKYSIKLLEPSLLTWQPKKQRSKQIVMLMSGGVDSSVGAYLLKEQGWEVLGITMKIPVSCDTGKKACCGADAAFVCNQLGMPHYVVDVTEPFQELIIERFRQSYLKGKTPNPCVDCNSFLKFSLLWDFLTENFGIDYLATGHYARTSKVDEQVYLGMAKDRTKDQSYFLYGINLERLPNLLFPLGSLTKERVRSIAGDMSLTVAEKAESMELCFAGEGDYRAVLTCAEAGRDGDITDMQGNRIGTHKGIANYTLGQRRGIGFAGGEPLYVGRIDAKENTIALGTREQVSFRTIRVNQVNFLIHKELVTNNRFSGKIRSYGEAQGCKLIDVGEADMTVEFDQPQFAPCPGQRLVLYNSDGYIVAGGTIWHVKN